MNKEQIKEKLEQLKQERWELEISTDFFTESERKKHSELCEEIAKLEEMLGDKNV